MDQFHGGNARSCTRVPASPFRSPPGGPHPSSHRARPHATRGPARARARTFSPSRAAWLGLLLPSSSSFLSPSIHAIETEAPRINQSSTPFHSPSRRGAPDPPPVSSHPGRAPPFPACALAGCWFPMRGLLAVEAAGAAASSASVSVLNGAVDWWRDVNESPLWQDRIFHALAVLYGIVSAVALVSTPRAPSLSCHAPDARLVRSIRIAPSDGVFHWYRFRLACGSIALFFLFKKCGRRAVLRDLRNCGTN